jgi:hypothetical protein
MFLYSDNRLELFGLFEFRRIKTPVFRTLLVKCGDTSALTPKQIIGNLLSISFIYPQSRLTLIVASLYEATIINIVIKTENNS